jgi:hypothetical protein
MLDHNQILDDLIIKHQAKQQDAEQTIYSDGVLAEELQLLKTCFKRLEKRIERLEANSK